MLKKLTRLLESFGTQQANVLQEKDDQGYTGWVNPNLAEKYVRNIRWLIMKNQIEDRELIHIANSAMFLWGIRQAREKLIKLRKTPKGVVRGCNSCGYSCRRSPWCNEPNYRNGHSASCWGPEFQYWKPKPKRKPTKRKGKR